MARRDTRRTRNPGRYPRRSRWGRTDRRDHMPMIMPGEHYDRISAGQVSLAAARGYGRWVARAPDTRGLATALVGLYPAGGVVHLAGLDPLLVAALGPPAAAAAWVGTYKTHASKRYSAAVTATAAGVPAWLGVAAQLGITNLPTLVGYTTAAAGAWSAFTYSDVLKSRRAWKAQQARWGTIAAAAGLTNSRLAGVEDTRVGQTFRVDIRATGKTARQISRSDLAEHIAGALSLPAERVRARTDVRHAGMVLITVQTLDPWADKATHPALLGDTPAGHGSHSIADGPLVLGDAPDTGHDLDLVVFDAAGGRHTLVVAATGGGKTTLFNNVAEQATARTDALVWAIDLGKGTVPTIWGPALDASAGIDEHTAAIRILTWAATVIRERSKDSGGRNHQPSPAAPVVIVMVDEMDTLIGLTSPAAHKARPLVEEIFRRGRSAGVLLLAAGQRGVVQHTGSKDVHANAGNKIVLRVNRASEMTNLLPEWEYAGMPNMADYAQGVRGVALVVDSENNWRAGRIHDLSDLDAVHHLAHQRGHPTATLEPHIAAKLPGYPHRRHTAAGAGASGLIPEPRANNHNPSNQEAAQEGEQHDGWGVEPGDEDAVARLARGLVTEVETRLADMPPPPEHPTSLANMIAAKNAFEAAEHNTVQANQAIPVPDDVAGPILELLTERGDHGARRDELVTAVGKPESSVKRWLRIMRDQDSIVFCGSGRASRYLLPEHAGPTTEHGDDDTPGGHAE